MAHPKIGEFYAWRNPREELFTVEILDICYGYTSDSDRIKIRIVEIPDGYEGEFALSRCICGSPIWTKAHQLHKLDTPVNSNEVYDVNYIHFHNEENYKDSYMECETARIIAPSGKEAIRRLMDYIVRCYINMLEVDYDAETDDDSILGNRIFITNSRYETLTHIFGNFKAHHTTE